MIYTSCCCFILVEIVDKRGKAKNVPLDQYIAKSNGIKPKVNIPYGKLKLVGAWAAEFTTELGIICRTYEPIRVAQWKKVEQKDEEQIYNLIRDKFEIDLNCSQILFALNKMLSRRFNGYKHELHKYYQAFNSHDEACEKPFNDMSAEDWELCCQEFASAKFEKSSEANTHNRGKAEINHCSRSKSFARYQHELDDGESVGPIEFWKKTHNTEKGWKTPMAQQLYEEMIEIQSQPSPMTKDEIFKEVMDKKSSYARERGYGEIGSSSSIAKRIRVEELQEAREKATNAEKRASELAQHVETRKIKLTETRSELHTTQSELHNTQAAMEALKRRQDEMEAMFQSAMEKYNTSSW
ncbi:hypothetical protein Syun_025124 [Stephania yunnanensis]|uniref:Transposase, Ptta/En/Spm, plant n=1 Tax=Stephania yunnanensis TaxID=152371 RepID=A0AAP0EZV9_9MAGN